MLRVATKYADLQPYVSHNASTYHLLNLLGLHRGHSPGNHSRCQAPRRSLFIPIHTNLFTPSSPFLPHCKPSSADPCHSQGARRPCARPERRPHFELPCYRFGRRSRQGVGYTSWIRHPRIQGTWRHHQRSNVSPMSLKRSREQSDRSAPSARYRLCRHSPSYLRPH